MGADSAGGFHPRRPRLRRFWKDEIRGQEELLEGRSLADPARQRRPARSWCAGGRGRRTYRRRRVLESSRRGRAAVRQANAHQTGDRGARARLGALRKGPRHISAADALSKGHRRRLKAAAPGHQTSMQVFIRLAGASPAAGHSRAGQGEPLSGRLTPPPRGGRMECCCRTTRCASIASTPAGFIGQGEDLRTKNKAGKACSSHRQQPQLRRGGITRCAMLEQDWLAVTTKGRLLCSGLPTCSSAEGKSNKIIGIPRRTR